jgi:hypothetical protein
MIPSILLGAPINKRKAYILNEWLEFILTLTYPNLSILLVDNSQDRDWHKKIIAKGFDVRYVAPKGRPEAYIAQSQEVIREYAVKNNYDYLFSLECDNFCPVNTIELLLAHRLDNVNVPYFLKEGVNTTIGVQLMGISQPPYQRYDIMPPEINMDYMNGRLRSGAPSIGCSLFSRELFEGQKFRTISDQLGKFSDSWWHLDSINRGIKPYVDTSLFSTHKRNQQWEKI